MTPRPSGKPPEPSAGADLRMAESEAARDQAEPSCPVPPFIMSLGPSRAAAGGPSGYSAGPGFKSSLPGQAASLWLPQSPNPQNGLETTQRLGRGNPERGRGSQTQLHTRDEAPNAGLAQHRLPLLPGSRWLPAPGAPLGTCPQSWPQRALVTPAPHPGRGEGNGGASPVQAQPRTSPSTDCSPAFSTAMLCPRGEPPGPCI